MGLFQRLFGGSEARATPTPKLERPASAGADPIRLQGLGVFSLEAVGESKYQESLEAICGGRSEDGADCFIDAVLIHEDENPYDSQAVRIDVAGSTVGYLSRKHAREYRLQMARTGHAGVAATCAARIRGGWDRGDGDTGPFGIRLDIAIV